MASIKDVAKYAGVAIGTVSRAFNDYGDIHEDTKQRIFEAARVLGYTPNVNARSLSSKVSRNIGIIASGLLEGNSKDNLLFMMIQGVYHYTVENDLEVALYTTDSKKQRAKSYTQFCKERSISGAILSGITTNDTYFKELIDSDMPCVTIDVPINGKRIGYVSIDNVEAAAEMTRYLLSKNHRRIMVVAGKKNASVTVDRLAGIYSAMLAQGLRLERNQVIYCNFSEQQAYQNIKEYLAEKGTSDATAFFCLSDIMALGVLKAVRESGYSVPENFSIAGFDGIPITEFTHPSLTTIEQNMLPLGYEAAKLLRKIITGEAHDNHVILPYRFIERDSVRCI